MPGTCLLCYITDRTAFAGDESSRRSRVLAKIAEAARAGVDYIQLREKDLSTRELESLARDAIRVIHESSRRGIGNSEQRPALLINSRTDVALAVHAQGVHLRSEDASPQDVRKAWRYDLEQKNSRREPLIGVSCHSVPEVAQAAARAATFAVFSPVFEKQGAVSAGLKLLQDGCAANIPVLALGGITLVNAPTCLAAGAAGVAAIRLFQENDIAEVVQRLSR